MSRRYRAGLIGCGYWGPNLLRNMVAHPRVDVAGVADRQAEARDRVRASYPSLTVHDDGAALLDDPAIELLVIATDASSHAVLVASALERGKHVLVEKPLTTSLAEARQLEETARRAGRVLMVGHTFLYNPAVIRLRELLRSGELGELRYLYSHRLNLGRVREDIGVVWNLGPHDISIILFLTGQGIEAISAQTSSFLRPGIEDVAFIQAELEGGGMAHMHLSWLDPCKVRRMTVVGSRKMAVYDDVAVDKLAIHDSGIDRADLSRDMGSYSSFGEFQLLRRTGDVHLPHLPAREPLAAELDHLLGCLDAGEPPRSGAAHGVEVVRALEGALRSAAEGGRRVELG